MRGAGSPGMVSESPPVLRKLTPAEERVIVRGGTEMPFSGEYEHFSGQGSYACKRCGAILYRSVDKFDARCGWPAFDREVEGAVRRIPDRDGERVEIRCARCGGHLGHVFEGEGFTPRNTRHCVNSISLVFVPDPPKSSSG
jgi:methionine-R-sulfoxide reductase